MSHTPSDNTRPLNISFKNLFYALASVSLIGVILSFGEPLLVPVAFGMLIAMILFPVCTWLEKKGTSRIWAIIIALIGVTIIIAGLGALFSAQLVSMSKEFGNFAGKLSEVFQNVIVFFNEQITILPEISKEDLKEKGTEWIESAFGGLLQGTLSGTGQFLTGATLCVIYVFLLLLYRSALAKAISNFVPEPKRQSFIGMLHKMRTVGQQYVGGMFMLILILGVLNTIGLLIIGIDYPFFFGFLAAFLAVIPYIGTTLGGLLPALFSLMNGDPYWMPIAVILVFWFIQVLEGNFLSPIIVGGNLNINPLAAILALIAGGLIWGVAGMILFLPYVAVVKVACDHYKELQPVGMMLRDDLNGSEDSKWTKKFKEWFEQIKSKVKKE